MTRVAIGVGAAVGVHADAMPERTACTGLIDGALRVRETGLVQAHRVPDRVAVTLKTLAHAVAVLGAVRIGVALTGTDSTAALLKLPALHRRFPDTRRVDPA
jgi:hypothetical protein